MQKSKLAPRIHLPTRLQDVVLGPSVFSQCYSRGPMLALEAELRVARSLYVLSKTTSFRGSVTSRTASTASCIVEGCSQYFTCTDHPALPPASPRNTPWCPAGCSLHLPVRLGIGSVASRWADGCCSKLRCDAVDHRAINWSSWRRCCTLDCFHYTQYGNGAQRSNL